MTTIYDVAAKAGVSPATVSRVFNGSRVSAELAASVRTVAAELSFVPNQNARRLRTQRSALITMMVPDIENPFFTAMTRAVEDAARHEGFSVMLCNTDEDEEKFAAYLRAVVSEPVAGIILVPPSSDTPLDFAVERRIPMVSVDRTTPRYELDSVVADSVGGARDATAGLFVAGYGRVACITGPRGVETAARRAEGWREAVRAATGREAPPELLRHAPYSVEGGEAAMRELLTLDPRPDGVLAANNKLAVGAIRVLWELDLLPPRMGVVSLGGLPLATWQPRGVTVAQLRAHDIGHEAARMLLERIRGLEAHARHLVLPTVLVDDQEGLNRLRR